MRARKMMNHTVMRLITVPSTASNTASKSVFRLTQSYVCVMLDAGQG